LRQDFKKLPRTKINRKRVIKENVYFPKDVKIYFPKDVKIYFPKDVKIYFPKDVKMVRISNTPLSENGVPIVSRQEVEDFGKVKKGFHRTYNVLLANDRGFLYIREIVE